MKNTNFIKHRPWNAPISFEPLEPEKVQAKYVRRCRRNGKTARDHAGGHHRRAAERKQIPIRCTSSHSPSNSIEKPESYWGRG